MVSGVSQRFRLDGGIVFATMLLASCAPQGVIPVVDAAFVNPDGGLQDAGEAIALDGGKADASPELDGGVLPEDGGTDEDGGAAADDAGPSDAGVDAGPLVIEMRTVPAGPFWRGCNAEIDSLCSADEGPGGMVTLSAFEIDATEVTQAAYARCVAEGPCSDAHPATGGNCAWAPLVTPNIPVVCVDWNDANTFCNWVGQRLPTEAEWEKAARGTDGRLYPWGNDPPDCTLANVLDCTNTPQPVGTHTGDSPYGVHDMAGNAWEWVADWYVSDYYATAPADDPPGPGPHPANGRVGRGGGFEMLAHHTAADYLRTSFRHPIDPTIYRVGIGFRCARSVP